MSFLEKLRKPANRLAGLGCGMLAGRSFGYINKLRPVFLTYAGSKLPASKNFGKKSFIRFQHFIQKLLAYFNARYKRMMRHRKQGGIPVAFDCRFNCQRLIRFNRMDQSLDCFRNPLRRERNRPLCRNDAVDLNAGILRKEIQNSSIADIQRLNILLVRI